MAIQVGQAPKPLLPTRSVLDYVGAHIRYLRTRCGLSQAELGARIFVHRDLVRRIETAERLPSRELVERCDQVLNGGGSLLRLLPVIERERLLRSGRNGEPQSTVFRSAAMDRPVLDWLLATPSSGRCPPVEDDAVTRAAATLEQLRSQDHVRGAGATYPMLAATLHGRLPSLATTAPHVATGMLELAGYEAVDLGADGLAQRHYLHALDLMTRFGNRLYGGYLVAVSLAHLALHCGDPRQALRLATAGLQGTEGHATPAVRAALRTVLARAHARLGDEAACAAALLHVEADLARSRPGDEPEWITYFGEADLADEKAHCFFDLGMYDLAYRETNMALHLLPPDRVRRISIDTALQAAALTRAGRLDQACVTARHAIDHAAGLASFRTTHRIVLMLAELQPHANLPEVREVADYACATLQPLVTPA
ncbi:helix-turn-helix domain-containing protein [Plantactinospora sp. CA-294935]|uniref:helix-turn-helix domain-containing protein n=1 Tax=Plantactinospora sp. CA-294935 TaxID=3240012 RepID=UPI003D8EFC09